MHYLSQSSKSCEMGTVLSPSDSVQTRKLRPVSSSSFYPATLFLWRQSWRSQSQFCHGGQIWSQDPAYPLLTIKSLALPLLPAVVTSISTVILVQVLGIPLCWAVHIQCPIFPIWKPCKVAISHFWVYTPRPREHLQIFHLLLQIFSPPFSTPLCAVGDSHGPTWTTPTGSLAHWRAVWSSPCRTQHHQGICEGGEGDQDALLALPCNSPSACRSALSTLPSLSSGSSNHLLPFPFRPRRGGHGHVVRSHIGTWDDRELSASCYTCFNIFFLMVIFFQNISWKNIEKLKSSYTKVEK